MILRRALQWNHARDRALLAGTPASVLQSVLRAHRYPLEALAWLLQNNPKLGGLSPAFVSQERDGPEKVLRLLQNKAELPVIKE